MRKRLFTILIAIATCVVVMGQEEMAFTPQWTAQAQFAGYYVALEKGFYKRELPVILLMTSGRQAVSIVAVRCFAN